MKKFFFVCLLALASLSATANAPTITGYWSVTRYCINHLTFTVSGNVSPLWVEVAPLINQYQLGPNIYNNVNFTSGSTVSFVVSPSVPTTYQIYAVNPSNYGYYNAIYVTVYPPCSIRKVVLNNHDWTARTINVGPQDPDEGSVQGMEVKWTLEELNPNTWETMYTIDNPSCWASSDRAGASNTFPGFDAGNTYRGEVTEIPCTGQDGTFDADRLYRITRYYRMAADEDWQQDQVLIGPGYEGGDSGARRFNPATNVLNGLQPELLSLAQDPARQLVTFNTAVDNGTLEVYDISGKQVQAIELASGSYAYQLNTFGLAPGIYVVRLNSGGQVTAKKFMIE